MFASFFICLGFGITTLQIPAMFVAITGQKMQNIGLRISWFFILSSLTRMCAPVFGFYMIDFQNGNISFLAHLCGFYLLVVSFFTMVGMMESNVLIKNRVSYHQMQRLEHLEDRKKEYDEPQIGALHSERKGNSYHQRLPSRSHSVSITPYHRRDESATNSKSKSKTKELMEEMKAESEHEDVDEGRDKVTEF